MMTGSMPKKGNEALPGLVGLIPARGVMTLEPVSVCQYVCRKMLANFIGELFLLVENLNGV